MKRYKCIIIEDEPLAQKVIEKHLESFHELELVATCENAIQAIEKLKTTNVDLLFLDITLPVISGIELLKSLSKQPAVIFTTAYSEYAVASYELNATDYLVKPVTAERFAQAVRKFLKTQEHIALPERNDFAYFKEGGRIIKVHLNEIRFIEARKDYLIMHLHNSSVVTHRTMKSMEEVLDCAAFIRIHRSYIVAKNAVSSVSASCLEVSGKILPIGDKYKANVKNLFV